jgi:hypothetical protein
MSDRPKNLIRLRGLLAERFPSLRPFGAEPTKSSAGCVPVGLPQVDHLLEGGLPKRAITELIVPRISGGSLVILGSLLKQAQQSGQWLALVDGADSFDPCSFDDGRLSRLLWVRCRNVVEAMKATDLVVRDNNLTLAVLDLAANSDKQLQRIAAPSWYRLQRVVGHHEGVLFVITPAAMVPCAQVRMVVDTPFDLEDLTREEAEIGRAVEVELRRGRVRDVEDSTATEAG